MKLEQKTVTTIVADEGKLLRRKSDGWVAGEQLTLGYNYYESGVGLTAPKLEVPDDYEEIDKPEDYEEPQIINHVARIRNMQKLMQETMDSINTLELSDDESLELQDCFPEWKVGIDVEQGDKYQYNGKLYEADQSHKTQENWAPGRQSSLWHEVGKPGQGTLKNPIPYNEELNPLWQGMVLELDKYYTQSGAVYKCTRDSGIPLTHNLKDLVGLYVEEV